MSERFLEGNQCFEFGEGWRIERYYGDAANEGGHPFYRNQVSRLPQTKAVDFVGILVGEGGHLIEVKDFRRYRIQNKKRLTSNELALEVAHKVRDTVAGLVGAVRNETNSSAITEVGSQLLKRSEPLRVILWLEDDASTDPKTWKEELGTLTTKIQGYLRWLTSRVLVVSSTTYAQKPPGIQVTNTPRTH
jgi:hypothetical protein